MALDHVVDELGHPRDAALDEAHDRRRPAAEGFLLEHAHAGVDRGERVAQIVAEHGDELLAQLRRLALVEERRLGRRHPLRNICATSGRLRLAGRGSIAHSVPKKAPPGRTIGIEM